MKWFPVLLCIAFIGCQEKSNIPPASDFSLEGFVQEEIPGSSWIKVSRSDAFGRLLEEGFIQNGKRTGTWTIYHDSEKQIPSKIASYVNGLLNGPVSEYNNRGGLTSLKHYVNEVYHGTVIAFKNGRITSYEEYKDGKLDGTVRSYFERSDQVQMEAQFKDGEQHGKLTYYNEEGKAIMEYLYENGEKLSGGAIE